MAFLSQKAQLQGVSGESSNENLKASQKEISEENFLKCEYCVIGPV